MTHRVAQSVRLWITFLLLCLAATSNAFQVSHRVSRPGLHTSFPKPACGRVVGLTSSTKSRAVSKLEMSSYPNYPNSEMERKIADRKKRVAYGYGAVTIGYLVTTVLILVNRAAPYYAAGPFMASWLSCILFGAANSDRLWSETYKRLNLCLAFYGAAGLAVTYLLPQSQTPAWYIPSAIALINSIKGYGYGIKGWELVGRVSPWRDIVDGFRSNLDSLDKVPSWKSGVYLSATFTVGVMKMAKLVEMIELAQMKDFVAFGTRLSRFAKLALLTAVTFTLKDAADRDRLDGITFIELNFVASVVFGTLSAFLYRLANEITPLGVATAGYSAFTAIMGFASMWKKKRLQDRDEDPIRSSWLT